MRQTWTDLGLLILRLAGGLLAFKHGWGKLVRLAGGEGRFVNSVGQLGFPMPEVFAWAAAIAETSGILIVIGLLTRPCAGLAAFTTGVAASLRRPAPQIISSWPGWAGSTWLPDQLEEWGNPELALVHFLAYTAILLLGPGRWSLDAAIRHRSRKRKVRGGAAHGPGGLRARGRGGALRHPRRPSRPDREPGGGGRGRAERRRHPRRRPRSGGGHALRDLPGHRPARSAAAGATAARFRTGS